MLKSGGGGFDKLCYCNLLYLDAIIGYRFIKTQVMKTSHLRHGNPSDFGNAHQMSVCCNVLKLAEPITIYALYTGYIFNYKFFF